MTKLYQGVGRRQFVKAAGALGATATLVPALLVPRPARAGLLGPLLTRTRIDLDLVPHLNAIALDTMAGVAAFVVPGNDLFSTVQGVATPEPGALASRVDQFLVAALDDFLPVPSVVSWLLDQLMVNLETIPLLLPTTLSSPLSPDEQAIFANLGQSVAALEDANGTVPLALLFALLLDVLAIQVDPASLAGPLLTPFSRLSWQNKTRVWQEFEQTVPDLLTATSPLSILPIISLISGLLDTLGGLVDFASGALLEFAAFAAYNEFAVLDPATRTLSARPIGWQLSGYQPDGPPARTLEGWDEFQGYFQGRREVSNA